MSNKRSTFASIAAIETLPLFTAATSAAPHGVYGPGIAKSFDAFPASTVVRTAVQSEITTPSNFHSPLSGSSSNGFSVIVGPFTELYADITNHGFDSSIAISNALR